MVNHSSTGTRLPSVGPRVTIRDGVAGFSARPGVAVSSHTGRRLPAPLAADQCAKFGLMAVNSGIWLHVTALMGLLA